MGVKCRWTRGCSAENAATRQAALHAMRLDAVLLPDPGHHPLVDPEPPREPAGAPVCRAVELGSLGGGQDQGLAVHDSQYTAKHLLVTAH